MKARLFLAIPCLLLAAAPATALAETTFTQKAKVVVNAKTGEVISKRRAEAGLTYAPPSKPSNFSHKYECQRLDIFTRPWPEASAGGGIATKGACDAKTTTAYTKWPAPAAFQVVKPTVDRARTDCKKKLGKSKPGTKVKTTTFQTYFPAEIEMKYTFVKISGPGMKSHRIERERTVSVPTTVVCRVPAESAKPKKPKKKPDEPKKPTNPKKPKGPFNPNPSKPGG